jgi:ParB family chromosome partitioning protein
MKIAIDQIKVDEEVRIRKEVGNLKPLEDSINKVGLINPILIDEKNNLVAGYRRLKACQNLNMKEIEVTVVFFGDDMMKMLDVEVAENFFRKDFTPEEILSTEKRRQEILESTREKGFFERIWLWLKNLFSPAAVTTSNSTVTHQTTQSPEVPAPPVEKEEAEVESQAELDAVPDAVPKAESEAVSGTEPEAVLEAEPEAETDKKVQEEPVIHKPSPHKEDRSIKWRSSK